jgi:hypothetical protein
METKVFIVFANRLTLRVVNVQLTRYENYQVLPKIRHLVAQERAILVWNNLPSPIKSISIHDRPQNYQ